MASRKTLQAYEVKDEAERRELPPLTWQLLSQPTAGLLLLGSLALWLRLLVTFVDFARPASIGEMVIWLTSALIVVVLAIGCAFVPPIFWSAIIPSTVASNVLSWLYAKYGTVGYWFCFGGALLLTAADLWLVGIFWRSQTIFQDTPLAHKAFTSPTAQQITLTAFTSVTVFLFVGFTAWALNRMTPRQLVAGIVEAQNAAEVLRAEKLKDVQFQVTYARAVSLLKADLLSMGVKEFGERAGEFAAIVADMEIHEATAFRNLAELMHAQGVGEDVLEIVDAQNDQTRTQYRRMIKALNDAADYHRAVADYGQEMAEIAAPHMLSAPPPPTEDNVIDVTATMQARTRERANVAANVPTTAQSQIAAPPPNVAATLERSADVRSVPRQAAPGGTDVTLNVVYATFGRGMFKASMMAEALPISLRAASDLIKEWLEAGRIIASEMRGSYVVDITKLEEPSNG